MKAVDLFAGCGGLSAGLEKCGINVVAAFEYWEPAATTYEYNFQHPVFRKDLSDVNAAVEVIAPFGPELIVGGPPCQDFSHAGQRKEGGRANLTQSFADIVVKIKPQWFVMENVDRAQNSAAFRRAEKLFLEAGYGLTKLVLDASLCGVPQRRKRFFCIGKLGEKNDFLRTGLLQNLSLFPMTPRAKFGSEFPLDHYYRHPRNYSRRGIFSANEPAPTMRGVNRPVPPGYVSHANDTANVQSVRSLTTEERAMIQTFPRDFKWAGNKTEREQMIGNAVPVDLAKFVGDAINAHSRRSTVSESQSVYAGGGEFVDWLIHSRNYRERSAKDIVSRTKRILELTNTSDPLSLGKDLSKIAVAITSIKNSSVRSQLKRAAKLYTDFLAGKS